jgi:hypothetical protein
MGRQGQHLRCRHRSELRLLGRVDGPALLDCLCPRDRPYEHVPHSIDAARLPVVLVGVSMGAVAVVSHLAGGVVCGDFLYRSRRRGRSSRSGDTGHGPVGRPVPASRPAASQPAGGHGRWFWGLASQLSRPSPLGGVSSGLDRCSFRLEPVSVWQVLTGVGVPGRGCRSRHATGPGDPRQLRGPLLPAGS